MEEPLTPTAVTIREVGPRDGIQSEKVQVPTDEKVRLINALSRTGLRRIEAVSFVSPKAIPQMADARAVWERIDRSAEVFYSALGAEPQGGRDRGGVRGRWDAGLHRGQRLLQPKERQQEGPGLGRRRSRRGSGGSGRRHPRGGHDLNRVRLPL